jgi:hypothetical protein
MNQAEKLLKLKLLEARQKFLMEEIKRDKRAAVYFATQISEIDEAIEILKANTND